MYHVVTIVINTVLFNWTSWREKNLNIFNKVNMCIEGCINWPDGGILSQCIHLSDTSIPHIVHFKSLISLVKYTSINLEKNLFVKEIK